VVSSKRSSGPESIRPGVDGLLVDPDDRAGISAAISTLLTDVDRADRMGQAAAARVKREFSAAVMVARNEEFFERCIRQFRHYVQ
jgi:glycosyltransferase involved in cell wall biosynthesis